MSSKYNQDMQDLKNSGRINGFMFDKILVLIDDDTISDDLYEDLKEDAIIASEFGVDNDKEYNVYFFIDRFVDDILNDTFGMKLSDDKRKELCKYIYSHINDSSYDLSSLVDHRILIYKWLCDGISKKAHPNISGKNNREIIYDIDKWADVLRNVYVLLGEDDKLNKDALVDYFTMEWDMDEKFKFNNWVRYYEEGNTEKYNVKTANIKKLSDLSVPLPAYLMRDNEKIDMSTYKREQTKREKELEQAVVFKTKMKARLSSLKRLVDKYNDILPKHNLDSIYDEIRDLDKSIGRLDVYASLKDCVVRSANRMNKFGFKEGAKILHKCADEENLVQRYVPKVSVSAIIGQLEGVSKILKSRELIRGIASIDILLNELQLASYFPELSDSQSKLIEAYGYASNKIEAIISKLRGGELNSKPSSEPKPEKKETEVKEVGQEAAPEVEREVVPEEVASPAPPPERIETEEVLTKPIADVKTEIPKSK